MRRELPRTRHRGLGTVVLTSWPTCSTSGRWAVLQPTTPSASSAAPTMVTTQEAIRRADVLYWMKRDAPDWTEVMNENLAWHRVNEVHLSEEAAAAFLVISNYKGLQSQELRPGGNPLF